MDVTVVAYYYRVTITTTTTVERLASEQLSEDIWAYLLQSVTHTAAKVSIWNGNHIPSALWSDSPTLCPCAWIQQLT